MSPFERRPKKLLDDHYDVMMDVCEAFQEGRKDFKPKDIVRAIQRRYGFSDSVVHKWVVKNYVAPLLEMRKIKIVQRGYYIYI